MADKIQCPNCKASIFANLSFCPKCGTKIYFQSFRSENLGDLYKILQVDPSAEQEVIEAAYKRLASKYHPDVNKSPDAQARMQEINKAYTVLSKTETRRQYNLTRETQREETVKPKKEQPPSQVYERKAQAQAKPTDNKTGLPKWVAWATFIVVLLAIVFLCNGLFSGSPTSPQPTSLPTRTLRPAASPTVKPTRTPFLTPTPSGPDCEHWTQIDSSQVGDRICGFGLILDVYSASEYTQIISFSETPGDFIIKGEKYYFDDVEPGQFVWFEGKLYESSYSLFLNIDDSDIKLGSVDTESRAYQYCSTGE